MKKLASDWIPRKPHRGTTSSTQKHNATTSSTQKHNGTTSSTRNQLKTTTPSTGNQPKTTTASTQNRPQTNTSLVQPALSERALAASILNEVINAGHSLNTVLAEKIKDAPPKQRPLIQELCYGVLRWYFQLDGILKILVTKPLKSKDNDLKIILLLGLYQLQFMRIAPHAAINETVNVTRELNKTWAAKLINGVLREFQRQQQLLTEKINQSPVLKYAHPKWLIKLLQTAWPSHWENIANANNQHAPMTLRVNQLRQTRDEYLRVLQQAKISALPAKYTTMGITLTKPCDVQQLPNFNEGQVSVQDAAAQLAAELLELQPNISVLDACAAPGGKTAHILETQPKLKQLTVLEIASERLEKIKQSLQRLNLNDDRVQLKCADATQIDTWWNKICFDRILIDAPCSGTGVIRRHPDIKLLRRSEDIALYTQQQIQLLNTLWPLLKPGGLLVYATCSVLPQENSEVIEQFLKQHPDADEKIITASWGISAGFGRQLFPQNNGHDGFYYCRIIKFPV